MTDIVDICNEDAILACLYWKSVVIDIVDIPIKDAILSGLYRK